MKRSLLVPISPIVLFLFALFSSCAGPEKLIQKGRYEEALDVLMRRLDKGAITAEKVAWLQEAYDRQEIQWQNRIAPLVRINSGSVQLNRAMETLEEAIALQEQLLPIAARIAAAGFAVRLTALDSLTVWSDRVLSQLVAAYAVEVEPLMEQARDGDKLAAREAYALYQQWYRWAPDPYVMEALEESHDLGTNHMLFIVADQRRDRWAPLPSYLWSIDQVQVLDDWTEMHFQEDRNQFDYVLYLDIDQLDVSPERIVEQKHNRAQRIIDGYRIRRDTAGNALMDSLGHAVKDPVWTLVHAEIIEIVKTKAAFITGRLELRNEVNGRVVWNYPVDLSEEFINTFGKYRGDVRALDGQDKNRIQQSELPFPDVRSMEESLWFQLMDLVAHQLSKTALIRPAA